MWGRSASRDAGTVVVHHDRPVPALHRHGLRRAGSTCGRCRAGCPRLGRCGPRGPATQQGSASSSNVTSLRTAVGALHGHGVPDEQVEAERLRRGPAAGRRGPARPGRRRGRSAPAAAPGRRRPGRSGPRTLSSSTRRITSRLVRRLVSGVRSSCDASRTSWLWARREDSSASSSRLKVRRSRPSSSGPPGESRRVTSVVSARSSTVSVSEFSGTEGGPGDQPARARRRGGRR